MHNTFKKLILLLIIVSLACLVLACGGNSSSTTKGGSATGSSDIQVSDPVFGFISEEEYDPAVGVDTSKKWTSLDVDTSYYLFLSFDVSSMRDNDGQSLLDLNITFDSLDVMDGTIEDVSTGMIQSLTFTDAVTGNKGKTTTASFKIPALSAEPKKIDMIMKITPMNVGESHIIIGFNYDTDEDYKILGTDGYTKNLKINSVKIDAPTIEVLDPGVLSWTHVKNAEYYMIYETGISNPVCDFTGNPIVISTEGYTVGSPMQFSLVGQLLNFHNIQIRAFSSNPNILTSDYSNSVGYTWN